MPTLLARGLSAGVVVVGLGALAVAAHLWHTEAVTVREAAAEVAGPHEISPAPPARTPGGLDFRPIPIDMTADQLQATQRIRIRNGLDRGDRRRRGPPGILVVSMDGLRPDYTAPYGAAATATPTLAELAKTSTVFTRSYANANETLFSHASFFTSTIPSHLGELSYLPATYTGAHGAAINAGRAAGVVPPDDDAPAPASAEGARA